ncbi:MAG: glycosyltransferase N-terminal domain-containing protein [Elusimicrobia bacterium]|nr:glycosyltransferase N-terminal domain-containing protein [Elusimicrobiota bacterium]
MNVLILALLDLLAPVAALGVTLRFLFSSRRGLLKDLPGELAQRLGKLSPENRARLAGGPVLWVHAASAGEVAAVEELLWRVKDGPAAPKILLTATTAAGRRAAQALSCVDAAALAPLDCWPAVSRVLATARPYALLLVETELWPHMIELAHRGGAAVALVNGRVSDRSFPRYRLIAGLLRPFLRRLTRLAAQTEADARRFSRLGVAPGAISIVGNMKYDRPEYDCDAAVARERILRLGWVGMRLFVAGSTHPGEHELVLSAFRAARARFPDLRLVLAPRHVEKALAVERTLADSGVPFARWSDKDGLPGADCLLLDAMGVLRAFYAQAAVAFVGGTLVPVGGHNLLEPALAGVPVLFGPHFENARQAAELLAASGCGFKVDGATALAAKLCEMLDNPKRAVELSLKTRDLASKLRGATGRTLDWLAPILECTGNS